jgi:hypothetical protein
MGYEHNLHKWYKTLEEAKKSYSKFLVQQSTNYVGPKGVVTPKGAAQGSGSRIKDFIVVQVMWIVYFIFS